MSQNNDELKHFGVPGMKWGKRKASYVTVRQGLKNARKANNEKKSEGKWTTKKKVAVGAAAVASALAVYGAVKIKQADINLTDKNSGRKYVVNTLTRTLRSKDVPQLKMKLDKKTMEELTFDIMRNITNK